LNPPTWYNLAEVGVYYRDNSVQLVGLKKNIYCARIWARTIKSDQTVGNSSDCSPQIVFEIPLPDSNSIARELKKDEKRIYSLECRWFDGVELLENMNTVESISYVKEEIRKRYLANRQPLKDKIHKRYTANGLSLEPDPFTSNFVIHIFDDKFSTLFSDDIMKIGDLPKDQMSGNSELKAVNIIICHTLPTDDDDSVIDFILCPRPEKV
jgi:hypothetical protein